MEERIRRINELAKKAKGIGLTDDEKREQAKLRREYIDSFKRDLQNTLDNTYIVDEHGDKRRLSEGRRPSDSLPKDKSLGTLH